MQNNKDILEQAVNALTRTNVPAGPSDDLLRQTLEQIEKSQKPNPFVERIFRMRPITRIAAAAIVIIGISAVFLFPTGGQSIALAAVYDKVLQTQAFMYKMSMTMSGMGEMTGLPQMGETQMDATITIAEEYGMKMENHMQVPGPEGKVQNMTQLAYFLPGQKSVISIMPEQKVYQRIEFTDDILKQTKKQNNDPREMIKQMLDSKYIELEQAEIDGVRVQGFQTTDPAYTMGVAEEVKATLWVDVSTRMPVKSEIWAKVAKMEMSYVIDGFQWDVPVTRADFEYVIPADYKEQGSMKMPEMTEDAAIKGFETYLKFFGQYPEKIDLTSLVPSLTKKIVELQHNPKTEYAKEFAEKMKVAEAAGDTAEMQKLQQEFMPVSSLAMFHTMLVNGKKDPAYYGDKVSPQDVDAVLMRWKTDSGKYKVVFGDLSSVEMEYEDMVKIEPHAEPNSL